LLCLTSQGVESRPSGATEDAGTEERSKRNAQGAQLHGSQFDSANIYGGRHNFGSEVNTFVSSEHKTDGTPKQGPSTQVQVSSTVLQIPKEHYIEKCVDYPISSARLRNKRSPFDYSGSTQNYNTNIQGGSHNFGHESHISTQQAANDNVLQSHQFTTSPQIKKTEEKIISKVCHLEKVSNPEQGSVDKTPERQKRAPFDYTRSTQSYGGYSSHVQGQAGSTLNVGNRNHQAYQGNHNQYEYQNHRPNYGPAPYQQPAHQQLQANQFVGRGY